MILNLTFLNFVCFMANKMYIHISAVNRKRPLTDLTFSFNLPYVGTLPETVKLLLQSFATDLACSTISLAIFCPSELSFLLHH